MISSKISTNLIELSFIFLKLGVTSFGGPLAHIAMMREEFVIKRRWFSETEFLDLVSATNLIPGPNSTELAIHIGLKAMGPRGLIVAGSCFILPAFLMVLTISVLYSKYGNIPQAASIFNGMKPVILAIILMALIGFRKTALNRFTQYFSFFVALICLWFGLNEILILLIAGVVGTNFRGRFSILPILVTGTAMVKSVSLQTIFIYFLKLGSVLFGSGYVLFAFLKKDLVDERMWLTSKELLDAIAIGQLTPGPVFTSATFIGYLLKGFPGAVLATLGIFIPSFFLVAASAPLIQKMRVSKTFVGFLNGVNAASFALLLMVTYQLGVDGLSSYATGFVFIFSFFGIKFFSINSSLLVIIGGVLGYYFF